MSVDRFQKTGSGILVSVLIGLIVVSFMFSDYQSFTNKVGSSGTIAKVGSSSVKVEEFRNEYNRQIQLYQQMFGKELSQQDIDGLNLKNNALESVINNKLLTNLASEVGISAGADEVKQEIKEISYFKTDENFDIEKYKFILSRNRLTPNEFEENILTDLKTKKLQSIIKTFPISSKYMEQINTFKGQKINKNNIAAEQSGQLSGPVQDILSSLYFTRTQKLETGKDIILDVNTQKNWPLVIKVYKKERVKTPAGEFECYVVEPKIREEGIFVAKGKKLMIWLTADEERIPVLMKAEVFIGHVSARLVRHFHE